MTGEITAMSALVQVRLSEGDALVARDLPGVAGVVEFTLHEGGEDAGKTQTVEAIAANDFIARVAFENLAAGAEYQCTTRIGVDEASLQDGPVAYFQTLQGEVEHKSR